MVLAQHLTLLQKSRLLLLRLLSLQLISSASVVSSTPIQLPLLLHSAYATLEIECHNCLNLSTHWHWRQHHELQKQKEEEGLSECESRKGRRSGRRGRCASRSRRHRNGDEAEEGQRRSQTDEFCYCSGPAWLFCWGDIFISPADVLLVPTTLISKLTRLR